MIVDLATAAAAYAVSVGAVVVLAVVLRRAWQLLTVDELDHNWHGGVPEGYRSVLITMTDHQLEVLRDRARARGVSVAELIRQDVEAS